MTRSTLALALSASLVTTAASLATSQENLPKPIHFDYETAQKHELKPHRRTIPTEGAQRGFNQLHLTLAISATGDVLSAEAGNDETSTRFWPKVRDEVYAWKFIPFESNGHPIPAQIEEYVDLVPPERLPTKHVPPPPLHLDSAITITLERTGCFGSCPSYSVTLANSGITFDGRFYVVAKDKHIAVLDQKDLRTLAQKFIKSDFYSMADQYRAGVTDNPTYNLSITIDGKSKQVEDYVGSWEGMPSIITELEEDTDELAQTSRWIAGSEGLVPALEAEHYNFKTYEAQLMLKQAAQRGESSTVEDLLEAGVPLNPLPAPKSKSPDEGIPFEHVGWLTSASNDPKTLQLIIDAQLSHDDQADKDLALVNAVRYGKLASVRALIDYGANPNANLRELAVTSEGAGITMEGPGSGSILIYAASSGNPDVVREILQYHPTLEARDHSGKTALFAAGDYRSSDRDGDRAECVRLLLQAGVSVNARDNDGNTPLHETFLTEVEEELLKLGANVNARNNNGETPIFTTYDDKAIPLFLQHGADLTIRNNKGQTALEAASTHGPLRIEALKKAIASQNQNSANPSPAQSQ